MVRPRIGGIFVAVDATAGRIVPTEFDRLTAACKRVPVVIVGRVVIVVASCTEEDTCDEGAGDEVYKAGWYVDCVKC
jgi:hypothetical protein